MKKSAFLFLIVIFILFLQANSGCQSQQESALIPVNSQEYIGGEIIVKFKPEAFDEKGNLASESIKALNEAYGMVSMEPVFKGKTSGDLSYIYKLKFSEGADANKLAQEYARDPLVVYAEPNYIMHAVKKESNAE